MPNRADELLGFIQQNQLPSPWTPLGAAIKSLSFRTPLDVQALDRADAELALAYRNALSGRVNERVSTTVLLCEDDLQEQLVRSYLKECGLNTAPPVFLPRNASRAVHGGNVGWVLREFPQELVACRRRHVAHASTLLIVVVDADDNTIAQRRSYLAEHSPISSTDPVVVLIPKRHIETWIRAALGQSVNENDSYKRPEPTKPEVRDAAHQVHGWARDNPIPSPTCIESLVVSLPEWRRIG